MKLMSMMEITVPVTLAHTYGFQWQRELLNPQETREICSNMEQADQ